MVTGGAKSGKSRFALDKLNEHQGPKYFFATCPKLKSIDDETDERIKLHKEERRGKSIVTIEEEIDLKNVFKNMPEHSAVILDCLTLWVNNLIFRNPHFEKNELVDLMAREFNKAAMAFNVLIVVTNEVGMGLVPMDKLGRHYRDLLGEANQFIASICDEAWMVSCGLPMKLK